MRSKLFIYETHKTAAKSIKILEVSVCIHEYKLSIIGL